MQSKASTVEKYLESLPLDRRIAIEAVRKVIKANLSPEIQEGMMYGMIAYFIPHSVYPAGYHCDPKLPLPYGGLASQKQHMSFYVMCTYLNPAEDRWLRTQWAKTGKKLDMGKSCIRFRKLEDLPLALVGELIKRTTTAKAIATYDAVLKQQARERQARAAAKGGGSNAVKKATPKSLKKTAKKATKKASTKKAAR